MALKLSAALHDHSQQFDRLIVQGFHDVVVRRIEEYGVAFV
jgi:hypothetical protein